MLLGHFTLLYTKVFKIFASRNKYYAFIPYSSGHRKWKFLMIFWWSAFLVGLYTGNNRSGMFEYRTWKRNIQSTPMKNIWLFSDRMFIVWGHLESYRIQIQSSPFGDKINLYQRPHMQWLEHQGWWDVLKFKYLYTYEFNFTEICPA